MHRSLPDRINLSMHNLSLVQLPPHGSVSFDRIRSGCTLPIPLDAKGSEEERPPVCLAVGYAVCAPRTCCSGCARFLARCSAAPHARLAAQRTRPRKPALDIKNASTLVQLVSTIEAVALQLFAYLVFTVVHALSSTFTVLRTVVVADKPGLNTKTPALTGSGLPAACSPANASGPPGAV